MWYKNIASRFFGLVTKHACDRQKYDCQDRASIAVSHSKNTTIVQITPTNVQISLHIDYARVATEYRYCHILEYKHFKRNFMKFEVICGLLHVWIGKF